MTTEIAVLNRLGIALATDSAVTISGNGHVKVFDTADKLFELSTDFPIAVMINGNMDCIGVPWEILVKDFRLTEGRIQRDTVERWAIDFLHYVQTHTLIDSTVVGKYISAVIENEIEQAQRSVALLVQFSLFESARNNRRVKLPDIDELLEEYLDNRIYDLSTLPLADSVRDLSDKIVIDTYVNQIDSTTKTRFKGIDLKPEQVQKLREAIAQRLLRVHPSQFSTGIVIAGFGATQTFPAVHGFDVEGRVIDRIKYSRQESCSIETSPDGGRVIYFAQTDVIQRLLRGADPRFIRKTADFIAKAVEKATSALEQQAQPKGSGKRVAALRKQHLEEIVAAVREEYELVTAPALQQEFSREFDRMIAMMPKQELIELAEALVSITAVERKATSDEGTVGGPVDVAFITKHEGFVWIKRKHYFNASLNPRYFWRKYGRPPTGDDDHGAPAQSPQGDLQKHRDASSLEAAQQANRA